MSSINVDGLPEPIIRSLEATVLSLKKQFFAEHELSPGDGLRLSAGGWADDSEGLDAYLLEVRRSRDSEPCEPLE